MAALIRTPASEAVLCLEAAGQVGSPRSAIRSLLPTGLGGVVALHQHLPLPESESSLEESCSRGPAPAGVPRTWSLQSSTLGFR